MGAAAALDNPKNGGIKKIKERDKYKVKTLSVVLDQPKSELQRLKKT